MHSTRPVPPFSIPALRPILGTALARVNAFRYVERWGTFCSSTRKCLEVSGATCASGTRTLEVPPRQIQTDLRQHYQKVARWLEYQAYPPMRSLDYRVVPFILFPTATAGTRGTCGSSPCSGGGSALLDPNFNRKAYIDALVAADKRDLGPLLTFARSGSQ